MRLKTFVWGHPDDPLRHIWRLALVASTIFLFIFFLTAAAHADTPWLDDYQYREQITLNHAGACTGYQQRLYINNSTGSDSGLLIYLDGHSLSWPNDFRFTTDDGETLLDCWRENNDTTGTYANSTWWAEYDQADGDTVIYLYYGKSSDTDVSNGSNTFNFFDDFLGASLDSSKWDSATGSGGSITVSGGTCTITNPTTNYNTYILGKTAFGVNYRILERNKNNSGTQHFNYGWSDTGSMTEYYVWAYAVQVIGVYEYTGSKKTGGSENRQTTTILPDTSYHIYEVSRNNTTDVQYRQDGILYKTETTQVGSANTKPFFRIFHKPSTSISDWILVAKYLVTDPTITHGEEENGVEPVIPTADFNADTTTGLAPLVVTFTDNSTGGPTSWEWDFGDADPFGSANSSNQNPPAHTYYTPGKYTVTLTATNANGSNTIQKTEYINVTLPTPDVRLHKSAITVTGGDTATVYAVRGDYLVNGDWELGITGWTANPAMWYTTPTAQYVHAGTHSLVIDPAGAFPTDAIQNDAITIRDGDILDFWVMAIYRYTPNPNDAYLDIDIDTTAFGAYSRHRFEPLNDTQWHHIQVPLNGSAVGSHKIVIGVYDCCWVLDDMMILPAGSPDATLDYATSDGTATAGIDYDDTSGTLTFTGNETWKPIDVDTIAVPNGPDLDFDITISNPVNMTLQTPTTTTITIDEPEMPPTMPTADFTSNVTSGVEPLCVQFNDLSTNTTSWQWDFDNNGTNDSTDQNPVCIYMSPGTYTVRLYAINDNGTDYEEKTDYITVIAGSPPTASFTSNVTTGVAPLCVQFNDTSTGLTAATMWQWDFDNDGINDSSDQNPIALYAAVGSYTVGMYAGNAFGWNYTNVSGYNAGVVSATFTTNKSSGTAPLTVQFNDTSTGPVTAWLWTFGDGANSTEQNPVHTYTTAGTYTAALNASNAVFNGTAMRTIRVSAPSTGTGGIGVVGAGVGIIALVVALAALMRNRRE